MINHFRTMIADWTSMLTDCKAPLNLKQVFNELLKTGFGEFSVFYFLWKMYFMLLCLSLCTFQRSIAYFLNVYNILLIQLDKGNWDILTET